MIVRNNVIFLKKNKNKFLLAYRNKKIVCVPYPFPFPFLILQCLCVCDQPTCKKKTLCRIKCLIKRKVKLTYLKRYAYIYLYSLYVWYAITRVIIEFFQLKKKFFCFKFIYLEYNTLKNSENKGYESSILLFKFFFCVHFLLVLLFLNIN